MKNEIICELLNKKKSSKKDFVDYLTRRIQLLDTNSEEIIIGIEKNNVYNGYIGKNVKVLAGLTLVENIDSLDSHEYIQFDRDERIIDLLYNNIIDGDFVCIMNLIQHLAKMTIMDSFNSMVNPALRSNIIFSNAKNGKITKYSDLKNQFLCMCVEKAILFHNICQILGIDSQIMFGTMRKNYFLEAHAFNIVNTAETKLLVDLTQAIQTSKNSDNQYLFPVAIIRDDEYNMLINGEKITIDMAAFTNFLVNSNGNQISFYRSCNPLNDVYGVGITSDDKKTILYQNIVKFKKLTLGNLFNQ